MKRIKDKRKTEKLRKEALAELRKTRRHFEKEHPALLEAVRQLVAKGARDKEGGTRQGEPDVKPTVKVVEKTKSPVQGESCEDDMVVIDRKKNLETVLKYAALKPGARDLKKYLKDILH
ncbi:MAG: hypothetical protein R3E13_03690 [Alphaproteobacteria bacterium]